MQPIKTIIAEDEPLVRERIRNLLKEDASIHIIAECENGWQASQQIQQLQPQLLFLDIQMPLMDGFEVLEKIPSDQYPTIIFVTAFDKYAIKAFEFEAFDYLLKPFDKQRFFTALDRAKKRLVQRDLTILYPSYFLAKEKEKLIPILTNDIIWATSSGNYVLVYTTEKQYALRKTLSAFEKELNPSNFRRIHRSAIINIHQIDHMNHLYQGDYRIQLTNGKLLTTSKGYRENLQFLLRKNNG